MREVPQNCVGNRSVQLGGSGAEHSVVPSFVRCARSPSRRWPFFSDGGSTTSQRRRSSTAFPFATSICIRWKESVAGFELESERRGKGRRDEGLPKRLRLFGLSNRHPCKRTAVKERVQPDEASKICGTHLEGERRRPLEE